MRIRTSITLEDSTLRAIDGYSECSRSRLIEMAVLDFLDRRRRRERDAQDVAIIEQNAAEFVALMADVLGDEVKS